MSTQPPVAPVHFAQWEKLFDELVEMGARERQRRLAELWAEDAGLARQLERLLAADAATTDVLEGGAPDLIDAAAVEAAVGEEAEGWVSGAHPPLLEAGAAVGPWRVVRLLGRGGMGEVYLAERSAAGFEQLAALKVIRGGLDSATIVRRFLRERQILARLDHPNLAHLLDGGSGPDGRPYFALEWVDGLPITAYGAQCGLDLEQRLYLVRTICQAVHSAHRRLVVHRDLKPANILVTPDGTVKLLDFGIAKLLAREDPQDATITQDGALVLTPAYAAPEQILGEPVTTATDIYSLGVVLYELITGTLPHRREQRALGALASAVEQETIERPSVVLRRAATAAGGAGTAASAAAGAGRSAGSGGGGAGGGTSTGTGGWAADRRPAAATRALARRVAGDLDLIVLTALHRDPARRYSSAQALDDDLGRFLAGRPIRAHRDELGYRMRKFLGRHRISAAAVVLAIAALVAGLGLSLWQAHTARVAARRADAEAARAARVKSLLIEVFGQSDPLAGPGSKLTAGEALERGAASIDTRLAGEPEVQADLLDAVARIETNLGQLAPALAHARRALALRQALLPPTDGRIALARMTVGDVEAAQKDPAAARRSFAAALPALIAAYGEGSTEVATARRGLGGTLQEPAERERHVELLRQALATFVGRFGEDHVESAETLHELGVVLEDLGRYGEAEVDYRRSEVLLSRLFGPRSANVALVESDLAGMLDRVGREAESRTLFERAIAGEREAFGERDTRLADTLFSYAILLIGADDHQAGERALTEALAIYGPDRFESGECLRYLGVLAIRQEHYAAAADFLARAAPILRLRGDDNEERWRAIATLGWAHVRLGRVAEGRRELEAAVTTLERVAGRDAYELEQPLEQLGEAQAAAGDTPAAVATLQRAIALGGKLGRPREVAASKIYLARALLAAGRSGGGPGGAGGTGSATAVGVKERRREARRLLDEATELFARTYPQGTLYAEALLDSGRLALAEGDPARARRDLAAAEPLLAARKGAASPQAREARRLLAKAPTRG